MKYKFHIGQQPYIIHIGSRRSNLLGPDNYKLGTQTIYTGPTRGWVHSPDIYEARKVDGWTEVTVYNDVTVINTAPERASIPRDPLERDFYETFFYRITIDEVGGSPKDFIHRLAKNLYRGFNFNCQILDYSTGNIFELSNLVSTDDLLSAPEFYSYLDENMGSGAHLRDLRYYEGILVFSYLYPRDRVSPEDPAANLYFGWLPEASESDSALVYLGCEATTKYDPPQVHDCTQDFFFEDPAQTELAITFI